MGEIRSERCNGARRNDIPSFFPVSWRAIFVNNADKSCKSAVSSLERGVGSEDKGVLLNILLIVILQYERNSLVKRELQVLGDVRE